MINLAHTARSVSAMMRVGFAEAVAYRAEMVVWILSTTMPLVMLPLWHAVSRDAPLRGFTPTRFTAYFLAAFVVRQVTSAWACWTMNFEVRTGVLSMRLLRPVHPLWAYAVENVSALPIRVFVSLPVALVALMVTAGTALPHSLLGWALVLPSLVGAWAITFLAHVAVGCLSLWLDSSIKAMDAWTAGFFVLSGYLVPVEMFPSWLVGVARWAPFRYQLGFPVDVLTGTLDDHSALAMLSAQWAWVLALGLLVAALWTRGIRRYGAFGG